MSSSWREMFQNIDLNFDKLMDTKAWYVLRASFVQNSLRIPLLYWLKQGPSENLPMARTLDWPKGIRL